MTPAMRGLRLGRAGVLAVVAPSVSGVTVPGAPLGTSVSPRVPGTQP